MKAASADWTKEIANKINQVEAHVDEIWRGLKGYLFDSIDRINAHLGTDSPSRLTFTEAEDICSVAKGDRSIRFSVDRKKRHINVAVPWLIYSSYQYRVYDTGDWLIEEESRHFPPLRRQSLDSRQLVELALKQLVADVV